MFFSRRLQRPHPAADHAATTDKPPEDKPRTVYTCSPRRSYAAQLTTRSTCSASRPARDQRRSRASWTTYQQTPRAAMDPRSLRASCTARRAPDPPALLFFFPSPPAAPSPIKHLQHLQPVNLDHLQQITPGKRPLTRGHAFHIMFFLCMFR